jgi:hypothetical protein
MSDCVIIIVPISEKEDDFCNVRMDRDILMEAIHKFGLSDFKLE